MRRAWILCLVAAGCTLDVPTVPCKQMGMPSPLVSGAMRLRLDVYGPDVHCTGNHVPASAGAPQESQSYMRGDPIALDIPPGMHTLVLTTFSDAAGAVELGSGCVETDLKPGEKFCDDLTVTPGPDIGAPDAAMDMACDGTGCPCSVTPDTCDDGFYCESVTQRCAPGCKTSGDCASATAQPDGGASPDCGASPIAM